MVAVANYLILVNTMAFLAYGIDKWRAKHRKWRISEMTLICLAVFGGSIGAWCGMKVWHHKTQHKKFKYGIPLILLLQAGLMVYAFIQMRGELQVKSLIRF